MEQEDGTLKKPLLKKLVGVGLFLFAYLMVGVVLGFTGDKTDHTFDILADLILGFIALFGWMAFFAQFVLPVARLSDRWQVIERLIAYIMGGHGPAIFIENGFTRIKEGEDKKKGPGVIWLDSASTAILRTAGHFTRTIGPGVHFTGGHEYIAATADLHTLTQTIGPLDNDEPFKIQENDPNYRIVKDRANLTSAITRDGITVCAAITINFRVKSIPGEGGTRFGFNIRHAEAAIRESIVRDIKLEQPVWNPLPGKMAVDLWREYLAKFRLDELFEIDENRLDATISLIAEMIKKRLTRVRVEMLDEYGHVVLENKKSEDNYRQLLKERKIEAAESLLKKVESTEFIKLSEMGLEVKSINIRKLFFMPDVEEQLIGQWKNDWLKNAQKEREQVEIDRKLWETTGKQAGLKDFAFNASREISQKTTETPAQALKLLVHATSRGAQKNPILLKNLNNELHDLSEIYSWLRKMEGPTQ